MTHWMCFPHWTFGVLTEDPFHLTSCPESVRRDVWLWILPFFQETHILQEFKEDFYGCLLKVIMLGFIRPMEDYSSLGNWRKLHSFEACRCISTGWSLLLSVEGIPYLLKGNNYWEWETTIHFLHRVALLMGGGGGGQCLWYFLSMPS